MLWSAEYAEYIAFARLLRILGLRGIWGLGPQLGVPPLHPVPGLVTIAVAIVAILPAIAYLVI